MSRRITTRAQVSGYRFGLARAEHALVRRDVRMMHDPMRAQMRALIAGAILAVVIVAGAGIYGFIRPQPGVKDAQIVTADSGAVYVLLDGVMHPAANIASARLILGQAAPVRKVSDTALADYPRGAQVGIVGGPTTLAAAADADVSTWTVCDSAGVSAVIVGRVDSGSPADAALVEHDDVAWLVYRAPGPDGAMTPVRARVDGSRVELLRALGLESVTPRPVGSGFLDSFPARPDLRVPDVPGRGSPGVLGRPVGSVVATAGVDETLSFHLILSDGVQHLSVAAAETMRLSDPDAEGAVPRIAPADLAAVPVRETVPLTHFPTAVPALSDVEPPVLCHRWSRDRDASLASAQVMAARRLPIPNEARPVTLATADGPGPALDLVYLQPGSGEHVLLTGVEPDSRRASTPFYISDVGVRYRLAGAETASILGLDDPLRAPWPMVSLLPSGPELSREAAAVTRDGTS
ncbi:type VII secretion protein EccB [Gordonia phthalatica]|uniref:Type VII secretion protein EccB n=1 Tax=Gordonia phthalatica TaxID=1136941 RepID=A0A0N9NFI3_9ACTN|nr:type VII secretion protein EccB [Gordonia phthalatica]ALG84045.1 hypothetical protein ACH46_05395 [Gordonia phthalatica]